MKGRKDAALPLFDQLDAAERTAAERRKLIRAAVERLPIDGAQANNLVELLCYVASMPSGTCFASIDTIGKALARWQNRPWGRTKTNDTIAIGKRFNLLATLPTNRTYCRSVNWQEVRDLASGKQTVSEDEKTDARKSEKRPAGRPKNGRPEIRKAATAFNGLTRLVNQEVTTAPQPPDAADAQWAVVVDDLQQAGIAKVEKAIAAARANGCEPEHVRLIVGRWQRALVGEGRDWRSPAGMLVAMLGDPEIAAWAKRQRAGPARQCPKEIQRRGTADPDEARRLFAMLPKSERRELLGAVPIDDAQKRLYLRDGPPGELAVKLWDLHLDAEQRKAVTQ